MPGNVVIESITKAGREIQVHTPDRTYYFNDLPDLEQFLARDTVPGTEKRVVQEALTSIVAADPRLDNIDSMAPERYTLRIPSRENV